MVDTLQSDQDIGATTASLSKFGRVWLLTVAALGVLLVIASMVALNAALPDLALQTAATQTQLTWVVDGYTLVLACLLLPAGALGDRYGRRGALIVGLTIFAVASFAPTVLDSPVQIIIARAIAGVGAAFIMPATLSLLTAAFPPDERNKAIGIWAGMASSGAIIGFIGTGLLLRHFAWQSIFYAFTIASVGMIVCAFTIRSSRDETKTPVDWIGAAIIGGALAVFVFGVVEAPVRGWTHPVVWGCMTAGVALGIAFTVVELRRRHPLLDVRLFAKPDFTIGAVGITSLFFANFGFFFVEMQYMQLILGYSPLQTAFALAPLAVPIVVLGATMHLILPRLGLRLMIAVGLLLIAIGLYCIRFSPADAAYIDLVWPLLVTSAGIGMCVAPATSAIMNAVPTEKQGVASAVNDTTREVGAALGIAVAGSVLAAQYSYAVTPGLQGFPDQVRGLATDSLASALEVAKQLGPQGQVLSQLAESAFIDAMGVSLIVLSAAVAVAGGFVALWAPGRDGKQLRILRRRGRRSSSHDELGGAMPEHDGRGMGAAAGDGREHRSVDNP